MYVALNVAARLKDIRNFDGIAAKKLGRMTTGVGLVRPFWQNSKWQGTA